MTSKSIFTNGGTVQAGSIYLPRKADIELLSLCIEGKYAYILTTRQVGKSSLMVRTYESLRKQGISSVIIDLTGIGTSLSVDQWFLGLLTRIESRLKLQTDAIRWWNNHKHLGTTQRFTDFFEDVVLKEVDSRVVIFIDEIDTTLGLDFTDDFFAAIRFLHNGIASNSELSRLSFVLIGVATPNDLIDDPDRTPFNIGHKVELSDFTLNEVLPFTEEITKALSLSKRQGERLMQWVLDWTGGHPYLTQHFCVTILDSHDVSHENLEKSKIDSIARHTFLGERSEKNSNLHFVRDMLTKRVPNGISKVEVLHIYRRILQGASILDEERSLVKNHLKLSGVVKRSNKNLEIRNAIYRHVFNKSWIQDNLSEALWKKRKEVIITLLISIVMSGSVVWWLKNRNDRQAELTAQVEKDAQCAFGLTKSGFRFVDYFNDCDRKTFDPQGALVKAIEIAKRGKDLDRISNETLKKLSEILEISREKVAERSQGRVVGKKLLSSSITSVAFSPDGTRIIVGGSKDFIVNNKIQKGGFLKLISAEDGEVLWETKNEEYENIVSSVAFSPDGTKIAVGSWDTTVRIWSLKKDRLIETRKLNGHSKAVYSVAFSPNRKHEKIVSGGEDGIRLWDAEGHLEANPNVNETVFSVAFSHDGKLIASGGSANVVRLWDLQDNSSSELPRRHDNAISSLAFSPDDRIVSGSWDNTVRLWKRVVVLDSKKAQPKYELDGMQWIGKPVTSVAFNTNNTLIISGSEDGITRLWDSTLSELRWKSDNEKDSVEAVTFVDNNLSIASGTKGGVTRLWDLTNFDENSRFIISKSRESLDEVIKVSCLRIRHHSILKEPVSKNTDDPIPKQVKNVKNICKEVWKRID